VAELTVALTRAGRIVGQTQGRLAGDMPASADRLISLHDPDARPIAKGRINKPMELGYKAQIVTTKTHRRRLHRRGGNQPDALQPAQPSPGSPSARASHPGRPPPTAATAKPAWTRATRPRGETVAVPRKGKISPARRQQEHQPAFRKLVKWRTGSEGRISHLKHRYGCDHTRLDGLSRARTWVGHGLLAHNLVRVANLATR
jgi:IS5 family transposase